MDKRYLRNIGSLTLDEQETLLSKTILVLGCGGLGTSVIEQLLRIGVKEIICFDGDKFDETNLNRQIFSTVNNIGLNKAEAVYLRAKEINPNVKISYNTEYFNEINDLDYLLKADVIIDCLDNIKDKITLKNLAIKNNKPLIYGSVVSYQGQVATILPTSNIPSLLYDNQTSIKDSSSLSFMVTLVASIEISETIKVLLNKEPNLLNKVLLIDGDSLDFEIVTC